MRNNKINLRKTFLIVIFDMMYRYFEASPLENWFAMFEFDAVLSS
jgi:hypothetical protein